VVYDAIIVGARCAGASLAMLLARQGARVLLVDRATFPSDIPHGHFIHRHGPRRLRDWGLLDKVASRTPAISRMVRDAGDFPLRVGDLVADGVAWGYGPRRVTFDKILIDAATGSGAELRENFSVTGYVSDGDAMAGIRGRHSGGTEVEERATITIGADGRRSPLAHAVRAQAYNEVPALLCYYFSYWSGVESEQFELYTRTAERRVIFSFKTEDDLYAIFVGAPMEELPVFQRHPEAAVLASLDLVPDFSERVRAGRRAERFYGATDLPNFYRKPFGPGWALAGDAGLHKDPYLALGICDALRDVEWLASAIGDGLSGVRPMQDALAAYERRRNEASSRDYDDNITMARFTPLGPEVLGLRAAVRNQPQQATAFTKAVMGMIDRDAFFNPENLQRVMAGATSVGRG
jgi:flavin-dependent dehydrogenase